MWEDAHESGNHWLMSTLLAWKALRACCPFLSSVRREGVLKSLLNLLKHLWAECPGFRQIRQTCLNFVKASFSSSSVLSNWIGGLLTDGLIASLFSTSVANALETTAGVKPWFSEEMTCFGYFCLVALLARKATCWIELVEPCKRILFS